MHHCHCCKFVPDDVLERLAHDPGLSKEVCDAAASSARLDQYFRELRIHHKRLAAFLLETDSLTLLNARPEITVFDCKSTRSLPGSRVEQPQSSRDGSVQRTYTETQQLAIFLREIFQRNSIDNAGMTLMSSVHYGRKYNNAMWNGQQMIYGDGDGELFLDFTRGRDVIGHEMAHGLTQYSLQLDYDGEAGGLNESMSDCFGAMFAQWRGQQDAASADWLLGMEIMGATSRRRGYTCMRDMSDPAGTHCLAPQPAHYKDVQPGMDPHYASGPPNLAFSTACTTLGGNSWKTIGPVWYRVMTRSGQRPRMTMAQFAARSRQVAGELYGRNSAAEEAVDAGWKKVGL